MIRERMIPLIGRTLRIALLSLGILAAAPRGSGATDREYLQEGEVLSRQFCGTCHSYPEPSLLPRRTWLHSVLPSMSVRMGRHYLPQDDVSDYQKHESLDYIPSPFFGTGIARQRILEFGGFPKHPLLVHDDWMKIVAYYGESAPSELKVPPRKSNESRSPFKEHVIPVRDGLSNKWISLHYSKDHNLLFAGSDQDSSLKYVDPGTFAVTHSTPYPSTPVSMVQDGDTLYVLTVGSMVSTDELKAGLYLENNQTRTKTTLFENIPRSVHLQQAHLGPGEPLAFLISGFGNTVGQISLNLHNSSTWRQLEVSNRPWASS